MPGGWNQSPAGNPPVPGAWSSWPEVPHLPNNDQAGQGDEATPSEDPWGSSYTIGELLYHGDGPTCSTRTRLRSVLWSAISTPTHDEEYHEPLLYTRYWEEDDALDLTLKSLPVPSPVSPLPLTIHHHQTPSPKAPAKTSSPKRIPEAPMHPPSCPAPAKTTKSYKAAPSLKRIPDAPTNMASPKQEEEDWDNLLTTLRPTLRHPSSPIPGHPSQATSSQRKHAPLAPPPARRAWDQDQATTITVKDLSIKWSPSGCKKLSPENKVLQAQFAAVSIYQQITNSTNIDRDILIPTYNFLILPKSNFRHSTTPSSLSCHATYKWLVEIAKGKDDSNWLAIIECSACLLLTKWSAESSPLAYVYK